MSEKSDNLSHFAFDLFLSYGWAGIRGAEDGDRGWVADFKRELEAQLSSELGRLARIHLDVEQSNGGDLPSNLRDAVVGSAAFLSVITPGSCRPGSWCHRELDWFLTGAADLLPHRRQLSSLLLRDVKSDMWPEALRTVVPTSFLNDEAMRGPVPRSELADAASTGGGRLQRLAIDLARLLGQVDQQIARTVMLTASGPHLQDQLERLAIEIEKRGGRAIRFAHQGAESEQAFRDRYARALKGTSLLVCLAGSGESAVAAGWSASIDRVLMDGANARFAAQPRQVIVWREGAGSDQSRWPDAQVLNSMGFEYLHSLLNQTLQTQIAGVDARGAVRQLVQAERPGTANRDRFVFIECVQADLERLAPLRAAFHARGYGVKFPLFQGDAALRKQEDLKFLPKCTAAAVYFGSRDDLEAFLACNAMAKTMEEQSLSMPQVVLLDPPDDLVRKYFEFPNFKTHPYNPVENVSSLVGANS